ncbi:prepilin-type N-terminal cleavage/methylation domain-containing protein [bacterium]|nr:prepilin-type N-terminal cleavage/methylation domain-containing protein [bacterium]
MVICKNIPAFGYFESKEYRGVYSLQRRCHENGFTLIELLIVVAILGILAAIVTSNYLQAIDRADRAACQQNLRTIHTALHAYRVDYNHFPPADGIADVVPHPDQTAWGCGPAANGYWSGVSLLLVKQNYCRESSLYCPALKRQHPHKIEAWSSCRQTEFEGKQVPQWRFLRYAYNAAATDVGGYEGGDSNIEEDWGNDIWLVRCMSVDTGQFDPDRNIRFPFRLEQDEDNPNLTWYGEFELTLHGTIRERAVQRIRH